MLEFQREEPDIYAMGREGLADYLASVRARLEQMDREEPENMESETFETWAVRHEELEDLADEIQDLLDGMEDSHA